MASFVMDPLMRARATLMASMVMSAFTTSSPTLMLTAAGGSALGDGDATVPIEDVKIFMMTTVLRLAPRS